MLELISVAGNRPVLAGEISQVDLPEFVLTIDRTDKTRTLERFRIDNETGELVVRVSDGSLWEIGRTGRTLTSST